MIKKSKRRRRQLRIAKTIVSTLLFFLYDILFLFSFFIYLPIYFRRKKVTFASLKERLGILPRLRVRKSIWIHVVSVGEVQLIGPLINKLKESFDYSIVISTTTLTGNRVAKEKYSDLAKVIFFPIDVSFIIAQVLRVIKPKIFIAVETEIWPNLFFQLKRKRIPAVIINGRISTPAFRRYKKFRPIIKMVLANASYIGVQNLLYKNRFLALGADPEKLVVSGNMKFESILVDKERLAAFEEKYSKLLKKKDGLLFIAASTHHPEEEIILNMYKNICDLQNDVSLLIAPRHIERIPALEKTASSLGFTPVRISKADQAVAGERKVFLLDAIGQLLYFYPLGDICFVGGSLISHGGQNILEPIYFQTPTVFGPSMENFPDIEEVVLSKGAGIKVKDPEMLNLVMLRLTNDSVLRDNLKLRCRRVFEEEKKSLGKNLGIILKCIAPK